MKLSAYQCRNMYFPIFLDFFFFQNRSLQLFKQYIINNKQFYTNMDMNPEQFQTVQSFTINNKTSYKSINDLTKYLTKAKSIQSIAKMSSRTMDLGFQKDSAKPEIKAVYVHSSNISKQLQKMDTRINVNKYQMIIEVKNKRSLNGKKQIISNQNEQQKYQNIFNEYLEKGFDITNPIISQYQTQDEFDQDFRQIIRKNNEKFKQIFKETQQKIKNSRENKKYTGIKLNSNVNYVNEQKMFTKISIDSTDKKNTRDQYEQIFQKIGNKINEENSKKNKNKMVEDATKKFQRKFLRCKENKLQNVFNRIKQDRSSSQISQSYPSNYSQYKSSTLKQSSSSQKCQVVYHTQNRLLKESMKRGMSSENIKKMIASFDSIIADMKVYQDEQKVDKWKSKDSKDMDQNKYLYPKSRIGFSRRESNELKMSTIGGQDISYIRPSTSYSFKSKASRITTKTTKTKRMKINI